MGYAKLSLITSDVWNPYRWRWFQDFRKRHPEIYMDKKMFSRKRIGNRKEQKGVGKPHGNASQTPKPNSTKKKQTPKQKQTKKITKPKTSKGCWKVLVPAI